MNTKPTTLLLLLAIIASSFGQAPPPLQRVYCPPHPDEPASEVFCTLEYNPVCAYMNDSTNGTTAGNPCEACNQQLFDYYIPGACEGDQEESSAEMTESDGGSGSEINQCVIPDQSATNIMCTLQYEPVCAYFKNDTNRTNGKTIGNACQACLQDGYDYYINGTCPGDEEETSEAGSGETGEEELIIYCDVPKGVPNNLLCIETYEPVCAYSFSLDGFNEGKTVRNSCYACHFQRFDYYTKGACPGQENSEELSEESEAGEFPSFVNICPAKPNNVSFVPCPKAFNSSQLVCAYNADDTYLLHGVTVENSCQACYNQGFSVYTDGPCLDYHEGEEEIEVNQEVYPNGAHILRCEVPNITQEFACYDLYDPVCAYYDNDTNQTNGTTIANSCEACFQQHFDYYIVGECPGDETSGEVTFPAGENSVTPVEDEEDQSGNSVAIKCQKSSSGSDVACNDLYDPVCAYHEGDPKNGKTISNSCVACEQDDYDYYTPGACDSQS